MSAAAFKLAPAFDGWVRPIAAIDAWLNGAQCGDRLTYAHGHTLLDEQLAAHMGKLQHEGEVRLHRNRADDGAFDYFAIRNRVRVQLPPRPRRQAGPVLTPAMSAVFLKLKAVARLKQRCPTNQQLASDLGLSAEEVKWAMRQLRAGELIHTRLVPVPGDPKYRIVTIVATGLETASPKGAAR